MLVVPRSTPPLTVVEQAAVVVVFCGGFSSLFIGSCSCGCPSTSSNIGSSSSGIRGGLCRYSTNSSNSRTNLRAPTIIRVVCAIVLVHVPGVIVDENPALLTLLAVIVVTHVVLGAVA